MIATQGQPEGPEHKHAVCMKTGSHTVYTSNLHVLDRARHLQAHKPPKRRKVRR